MIYEYECKSCGHTFEKVLKVDDRLTPEKEECPHCQALEVTLKISAVPWVKEASHNMPKRDPRLTEKLKAIRKANPGSTIRV
jgi:putative FmdB family regulatory protein